MEESKEHSVDSVSRIDTTRDVNLSSDIFNSSSASASATPSVKFSPDAGAALEEEKEEAEEP